jgi:hypothetical protein
VAAQYGQQDVETMIMGTEVKSSNESYYILTSYQFNDLFTLGVYYSILYPYMDDREGDDLEVDHNAWEKDFALTLRFDINSYCIFKLEGHAVDGTGNVMVIDNTDNDYDEENWYYGAAKVTVSF